MPKLVTDPRFATGLLRFANRSILNPALAAAIRNWTTRDLVRSLSEAGVPAGAVNDFGAAFDDEHVRHRGVRIDMPHPVAGNVSLISSPLRMSVTPPAYKLPPPQLGEHTDAILSERLGLTESELAALRRSKII